MTPHEEAISLLNQTMNILTAPGSDLVAAMRLCQHACQLLGWENQKNWFFQELNGYSDRNHIPDYRKIQGEFAWLPKGSIEAQAEWLTANLFDENIHHPLQSPQPAILEIFAGLDWIQGFTSTGYMVSTGETKTVRIPRTGMNVQVELYKRFPNAVFANLISKISGYTYNFASTIYSQLKYGNAVQDIWSGYRVFVDKALIRLNLQNHLEVIQTNMHLNNPEAGRIAVFECRNLINDLANYLWRDERKTYALLPGDKGVKLDVTIGKTKNRIRAYFHQKKITGTVGEYLDKELNHLVSKIETLISLQSMAHQPIEMADARSIVLATYFVIGELSLRTDLMPIDVYIPLES